MEGRSCTSATYNYYWITFHAPDLYKSSLTSMGSFAQVKTIEFGPLLLSWFMSKERIVTYITHKKQNPRQDLSSLVGKKYRIFLLVSSTYYWNDHIFPLLIFNTWKEVKCCRIFCVSFNVVQFISVAICSHFIAKFQSKRNVDEKQRGGEVIFFLLSPASSLCPLSTHHFYTEVNKLVDKQTYLHHCKCGCSYASYKRGHFFLTNIALTKTSCASINTSYIWELLCVHIRDCTGWIQSVFLSN